MEKVSVSRLKDQLSAYLRKVRQGQTVLVMDRNRPIARLTPITDQVDESEHIARLIALGIVTPPKGPPLSMEEIIRRRPVVPGAGVLEALLEERREGR
jgi:prevent-host-death family protein